jgi:predicted transcriptional regulator
LVQNFDPHLLNSTIINETAAQNDFKNHMLYHLNALLDMYASINDITQTIKQVQKQKDNVRERIFQLQEDHTRVGQELNMVRNGHRQVSEKHQQIESISRQLLKLQSMDGRPNIDHIVQQQLREMTKTIAPGVGVCTKLHRLNEKLTIIDQELP